MSEGDIPFHIELRHADRTFTAEIATGVINEVGDAVRAGLVALGFSTELVEAEFGPIDPTDPAPADRGDR